MMITKTPLRFPLALGDDVDVNMQPDSTQPPHWVPAWIVALEQITGPDEVFGVPVSHINPPDRGGSAYWIAKVTTHDQSSTVWAHKQDLRTAIPDSSREAEEDRIPWAVHTLDPRKQSPTYVNEPFRVTLPHWEDRVHPGDGEE